MFGGSRNLGVSLTLFNSETAIGSFFTTRDFQNTVTQPAFLWDYRWDDLYNHRRQKNVTLKTDYRLTPSTKVSFLTTYIDHSEVFRRQYNIRAFTNGQSQDTVPSATTSIVPGYTSRITTVRPVASSVIDVTMTGPNNFFNRLRRVDAGFEHEKGPLQLEGNLRYTQTHINIGNGEGAVLTNRISGTGWIIDRTESDLYPKFLANGGLDFTKPVKFLTRSGKGMAGLLYVLPGRKDGTFGAAEPLNQLVADVARLEAGEHQHVGVAADPRVRVVLSDDLLDERRGVPAERLEEIGRASCRERV